MSLDVHPFSEVVYSESGISPCLNQELCTDFPLKMTRQRVRLPTAEAVSMIETHSRFSGDFLYDLVVEELPTTSWFTQTPRAMPVSSIFQASASSTWFSVLTFLNFSNRASGASGVVFRSLWASILTPNFVWISGCLFKNLSTQ